ncbi:MAG: hypothetical protein ACJ713_08655 [Candidatus Sulfotelmatobacter sp.]
MPAIPWRMQLGFVAAFYAAVLGLATTLVVERYLQYGRHPEYATASSGMYAGGDLMLEIFIAGALLVPTIVLVLVIAKSEAAFTIYSKILLAFSLSAPLAFGLLSIPAMSSGPGLLGFVCLYRLEASPFTLAAAGFSRGAARFQTPKRLTLFALQAEGLTLVAVVSGFAFSVLGHHR